MGKSFYILLWGGLFFLSIGLWMMKRDRDEMRMREARMIEKENSLYELYESLEEIMNEMIYHYRDRDSAESTPITTKDDRYDPVLETIDQQSTIEKSEYESQDKVEGLRVLDSERQKYHQITSLIDQGFSIEEIAKELGIGKGEIMLVLKLYKG
jgi:DNA-directed RNA polymerase specialized sigma24 family protein